MVETTITDVQWDGIIEEIHLGGCVPFLGAAVNVSREGYEGLPLGRDVAIHLLKAMLKLKQEELDSLVKDEKDILEKVKVYERLANSPRYKDLTQAQFYNLARVALHVQLELNDEKSFLRLLKSIIAEEECKPSLILNTLAQLPFKLIITTNYDQLMEKALDLHNRAYKIISQPKDGFSPKDKKKIDDKLREYDGLTLYKIHGTFSIRDKLSYISGSTASPQVIITEDDYISYLTVIGAKDRGMPDEVKAQIARNPLLFLGYGLEDWDFRTIFKSIIEPLPKNDKRHSFAIQKNPSEFWIKFWDKKNVSICDFDLYVFIAELERRYKEYVAKL